MANGAGNPGLSETNKNELKSYRIILPMGSLSIGVDNIHYDVFLSPKFVQTTRDYLFDLIRQNVSSTYFSGIDFRSNKQVDSTTFRKLLTEILQSSLNRAKHQKNIEIDVLFRLAILKFLSGELVNQFANVILDGKEYIRKRGEYFERSQQAHVIKARLSEMQSGRRDVLRLIGQLVAQIIHDIDENVIAKARKALFGEEFNPYYELLKNRLIFLDGGKDDWYFLEHYVLLGNYARDPDRIEAMDELFQEFMNEAGVSIPQAAPASQVSESFKALFEEVNGLKKEIGSLEEQRESLAKRSENTGGLFNKLLSHAPGSCADTARDEPGGKAPEGSTSTAGRLWAAVGKRATTGGLCQSGLSGTARGLPERAGKCQAVVRRFERGRRERAYHAGKVAGAIDATAGRARIDATHSGEL